MPVVARVDWMKSQVLMGRMAHISISCAQDTSKVKYKIVLDDVQAGQIPFSTMQAISIMLDQLRMVVVCNPSVDRGHRYSNGKTEIAIWVQFLPSATAADRNHGPSLRRGRSPGEDDREDGKRSQDRSSRRSCDRPSKVQRSTRSIPSSVTHGQQGSMTAHANDSVTPDPPMMQRPPNTSALMRKLPLDLLVSPSVIQHLQLVFSAWAAVSKTPPKTYATITVINLARRISAFTVLLHCLFSLCVATYESRLQGRASGIVVGFCRNWLARRTVEVTSIAGLLENSLGYSNDDSWIRICTAVHRARTLVRKGWTSQMVHDHLSVHNDMIDFVRVGHDLQSLDVSCWFLVTRSGKHWASSSDMCRVRSISHACEFC